MSLLISSLLVAILLLLAIVNLERIKPRPRDLMPVVVLAALAILGRVAMMPIPNFQPATALIVLAGFFFGRNAGLLCGMVVALVSNLLLGHGPWTPWQMLAWGLVGYGAGILGGLIQSGRITSIILQLAVIVYGTLASLLFGMLMDLQFFIAYAWETGWSGLIATWTVGMPMNLSHAASTLIFLTLTLVPWGKKLQRLKTKYGIQLI